MRYAKTTSAYTYHCLVHALTTSSASAPEHVTASA